MHGCLGYGNIGPVPGQVTPPHFPPFLPVPPAPSNPSSIPGYDTWKNKCHAQPPPPTQPKPEPEPEPDDDTPGFWPGPPDPHDDTPGFWPGPPAPPDSHIGTPPAPHMHRECCKWEIPPDPELQIEHENGYCICNFYHSCDYRATWHPVIKKDRFTDAETCYEACDYYLKVIVPLLPWAKP
jgi:hypothetical protein